LFIAISIYVYGMKMGNVQGRNNLPVILHFISVKH